MKINKNKVMKINKNVDIRITSFTIIDNLRDNKARLTFIGELIYFLVDREKEIKICDLKSIFKRNGIGFPKSASELTVKESRKVNKAISVLGEDLGNKMAGYVEINSFMKGLVKGYRDKKRLVNKK